MEGRPDEAPVINITGELVMLGPLRRDLLPLYQRWINDFGAVRNMGIPRPLTYEQETAWYDQGENDGVRFTIYERATGRPVGNTGLHGVDHRNRTAEFGLLIGEADCRGKGYGTETARLMLDYAFTALGLHSLMLRVHEFNLAGRRAYAKAGYRECGRRRQCLFMGGRFWDEIFMDYLASEFTSPVLAAILKPDEPHAD
jgi:RimJ/RimL family protein N-acetyltransferase